MVLLVVVDTVEDLDAAKHTVIDFTYDLKSPALYFENYLSGDIIK